MTLAAVLSRAQTGLQAPQVTVEVHLGGGLPQFSIVGLPEKAVRESRDRVRAALLNTHAEFPKGRVTVNLAPADLPKEGGRYDLPIAIGILVAQNRLPTEALSHCEFYGELSLSGELRRVRGMVPAALAAGRSGHAMILPAANGAEAGLMDGLEVYPAPHLLDVCAHLAGRTRLARQPPTPTGPDRKNGLDLGEVKAQHFAKRAVEVAAAGEHSLLLVGPPGAGKTMLARRLPGLLPPLTHEEALESAAICSVSSLGFDPAQWRNRPFRSPHHSASAAALVGGGSNPRPGEISLAHHGVLFLDELPEFNRRALEVLREPLESGSVCISRAAVQADFPARFQLVGAMNPCPCGYLGDRSAACRCSADQVQRYRGKLSGPLLDRIDLHVDVPALAATDLHGEPGGGETTCVVAARVAAARSRQWARQRASNATLSEAEVEQICRPGPEGSRLLARAINRLHLSARSYHRVLKVARTIADLADEDGIQAVHIGEAIGFRRLDRPML